MPAAEPLPHKSLWWLETTLWSVLILGGAAIAAYVNETAREILTQGLAYLFTFMSTPFVMETSTAFIGVCVVMIINARRIEREGDGWVEMEIEVPDAPNALSVSQTPSDKAGEN